MRLPLSFSPPNPLGHNSQITQFAGTYLKHALQAPPFPILQLPKDLEVIGDVHERALHATSDGLKAMARGYNDVNAALFSYHQLAHREYRHYIYKTPRGFEDEQGIQVNPLTILAALDHRDKTPLCFDARVVRQALEILALEINDLLKYLKITCQLFSSVADARAMVSPLAIDLGHTLYIAHPFPAFFQETCVAAQLGDPLFLNLQNSLHLVSLKDQVRNTPLQTRVIRELASDNLCQETEILELFLPRKPVNFRTPQGH